MDSKRAVLVKSSAVMAVGTLTSRILGLVKTMMLATAIGVTIGGAADAFDIANKVPNTLYMLLAGGVLNAVLVPQVVRATKRHDGGQDFTNRLLTLALLLLIGVTMVATLCAPLLVWIYSAPTWPAQQTALAVAFAFWCLPQLFFYGLYTLIGQVLNANSSFGPYMWAPVVNNVVAIGGLAVFVILFGPGDTGQHAVGTWDAVKIALLAGSATLGVVCQALILVWPLKRTGFRYSPVFGFRGGGLGSAARVAGWAFAALLVGHLGFIVVSRVASTSTSTEGEVVASNAAYSLAYLVFMLPHSIIAVSLGTALLTSMSQYAAYNDVDSVRSSLAMSIRLVGLVNVFASVAFIVLSDHVAMVLGGGTGEQAKAIGLVITTMIVGLVPFSANYLLQRVFYAYEDARTPFIIKLPQVVFTSAGVVFSAFLPQNLVVAGIGVSMSAGYGLAAVLSFVQLRRRLGHLEGWSLLVAHLKFVAAGVVAAAVGLGMLALVGPGWGADRGGAFLSVIIVGHVMLVGYMLACYVLRVSELHGVVGTISAMLGR